MAAPRKENVKDIIMDTTEALLEAQSLDDMSLAQIATAAGISKGTLYYHYKTKEDILLDITDRFLAQQGKDFFEWVDNKEKDTSLHRIMKYTIERNVKGCGPRIHLIYHACIGNKEVREKIIERYNKFQTIISNKIAERAGEEYADYLSWVSLLIADGLIIQERMGNPNIDIDDFVNKTDKFAELFPIK